MLLNVLNLCSAVTQFRYILQVSAIYPDVGSLAGGSHVTIMGQGFGTSLPQASISFGDVNCEVESVTDAEIQCVTRQQHNVVFVDNQGKHEGKHSIKSNVTKIGNLPLPLYLNSHLYITGGELLPPGVWILRLVKHCHFAYVAYLVYNMHMCMLLVCKYAAILWTLKF